MSFVKITQNSTFYLELFVTGSNGKGVSGLNTTYKIYQSSNDSLIDSGNLTEVGGGIYKKGYTFSNLGQFRIVYYTPSGYEDKVLTIKVVEETADDFSEIHAKLNRILGLSQENYRILNPTYIYIGGAAHMTSGIIRIYPSASDCDNDTNHIAEYQITAVYDNEGKTTSYKVTKI